MPDEKKPDEATGHPAPNAVDITKTPAPAATDGATSTAEPIPARPQKRGDFSRAPADPDAADDRSDVSSEASTPRSWHDRLSEFSDFEVPTGTSRTREGSIDDDPDTLDEMPRGSARVIPNASIPEDGLSFSRTGDKPPTNTTSTLSSAMANLNHAFDDVSENGSEESTETPKSKRRLWNSKPKNSGANAPKAMQGNTQLTDKQFKKILADIKQHLEPDGYTVKKISNNRTDFNKKTTTPPLSLTVQRDNGKLRMLSNLPPIELAAAWETTGQTPLTISQATPENAKAILRAFEENHPKFRVIISDTVLQSMDLQGKAAYKAHQAKWLDVQNSPSPAESESPSTPPSTDTASSTDPDTSPSPSPSPSPGPSRVRPSK